MLDFPPRLLDIGKCWSWSDATFQYGSEFWHLVKLWFPILIGIQFDRFRFRFKFISGCFFIIKAIWSSTVKVIVNAIGLWVFDSINGPNSHLHYITYFFPNTITVIARSELDDCYLDQFEISQASEILPIIKHGHILNVFTIGLTLF